MLSKHTAKTFRLAACAAAVAALFIQNAQADERVMEVTTGFAGQNYYLGSSDYDSYRFTAGAYTPTGKISVSLPAVITNGVVMGGGEENAFGDMTVEGSALLKNTGTETGGTLTIRESGTYKNESTGTSNWTGVKVEGGSYTNEGNQTAGSMTVTGGTFTNSGTLTVTGILDTSVDLALGEAKVGGITVRDGKSVSFETAETTELGTVDLTGTIRTNGDAKAESVHMESGLLQTGALSVTGNYVQEDGATAVGGRLTAQNITVNDGSFSTASIAAEGDITVASGVTFTNTGSIRAGGTFKTSSDVTGTEANLGGLVVTNGATVAFTNTEDAKLGAVELAGNLTVGNAKADSVLMHAGSLESGKLTLTGTYKQEAGTGTVNGLLTAGSVEIAGGAFNADGIDATGDVTFAAGSSVVNTGELKAGGLATFGIDYGSATQSIRAGAVATAAALQAKTLTVTNLFKQTAGSTTVAEGATLGALDLAGGTFAAHGLSVTGDATVAAGTTLTDSGDETRIGGTFRLSTDFTGKALKAGALTLTAGDVELQSIDVTNAVTVTDGSLTTASVLKAGTLSHTGGTITSAGLTTTGDAHIGATYANTGNVTVGGSLVLDADLTADLVRAGALTLKTGRSLTAAGNVTVAGTAELSGRLALAGADNTFGDLRVKSGAELAAAGKKVNATKAALAGSLAAKSFTAGTLELTTGSIAGAYVDIDRATLTGGSISVAEGGTLRIGSTGTIGSAVTLGAGSSSAFGTTLREAASGRTALALGQGLVIGRTGSLTVGTVRAARAGNDGSVRIGADVDVTADLSTFNAENFFASEGESASITVADGSTFTVTGGSWGRYQLSAGFDSADVTSWTTHFTDAAGRDVEWVENANGGYDLVIGSTDIEDSGITPAAKGIVNAALVAADRSVESEKGDVAFINRALSDAYLAEDLRAATLDTVMQIGAATGSLAAANRTVGMTNNAVAARLADRTEGRGLWIEPLGGVWSADTEATGVKGGYDFSAAGIIGGVEWKNADGLCLGAAALYAAGSTESTGGYVSGEADTDAAGLYGYAGTRLSMIDLSLWGGWLSMGHDATVKMPASMQGAVKADADLTALTFGVNASGTFRLAGFDLTPHAGLRVVNVKRDAFETSFDGRSAFRTDSTKATVVEFPVGVTASKSFETASGIKIRPMADLTVTARGGDKDADVTVHAASLNAYDSVKETVTGSVNGALTFGIAAESKNFTAGASLSASAGADGEKGVEFGGRLTWRF